jgi:hypothetical protein
MNAMRRSRRLAQLAATLTVGAAGLAVSAPVPAQAGVAIQAHVMAGWGAGLLGDEGPGRSLNGGVIAGVHADQRALHDWLNPAASRAAMDGSLAADFSASISRLYAAAPCRAARSRAASSLLANAM